MLMDKEEIYNIQNKICFWNLFLKKNFINIKEMISDI